MSHRITKADIAVQAAILASYSQAAGIIADGDRLTVDRTPGAFYLYIIPAGGSNRSTFPATGSFGTIGTTARDAFNALNAMQETMRATLDALNVPYAYPREAVAAIRGEK